MNSGMNKRGQDRYQKLGPYPRPICEDPWILRLKKHSQIEEHRKKFQERIHFAQVEYARNFNFDDGSQYDKHTLDPEPVRASAAEGGDGNAEEGRYYRAATVWNLLEVLQEFEEHTEINSRWRDEALMIAAHYGYRKTVDWLLSKGADPNAPYPITRNTHPKSNQPTESLIAACERGHVEIAQQLLEHGADVHARGDQALKLAIQLGCLPLVKALLQHGADITPHRENAVYWAVQSEYPKITLEVGYPNEQADMEELGRLQNQRVIFRSYERMCAEFEEAQMLGKKYLPTDEEQKRIRAIQAQRVALTDLMCELGGNVNEPALTESIRYNAKVPLFAAIFQHSLPLLEVLLARGADLHIGRDYAINIAAKTDDVTIMQWLLDQGLDVHAWDDLALYTTVRHKSGHLAFKRNNVDMAEFLLHHGLSWDCTDPDCTTPWGDLKEEQEKTARETAAKHGHAAIMGLLIYSGEPFGKCRPNETLNGEILRLFPYIWQDRFFLEELFAYIDQQFIELPRCRPFLLGIRAIVEKIDAYALDKSILRPMTDLQAWFRTNGEINMGGIKARNIPRLEDQLPRPLDQGPYTFDVNDPSWQLAYEDNLRAAEHTQVQDWIHEGLEQLERAEKKRKRATKKRKNQNPEFDVLL